MPKLIINLLFRIKTPSTKREMKTIAKTKILNELYKERKLIIKLLVCAAYRF